MPRSSAEELINTTQNQRAICTRPSNMSKDAQPPPHKNNESTSHLLI